MSSDPPADESRATTFDGRQTVGLLVIAAWVDTALYCALSDRPQAGGVVLLGPVVLWWLAKLVVYVLSWGSESAEHQGARALDGYYWWDCDIHPPAPRPERVA